MRFSDGPDLARFLTPHAQQHALSRRQLLKAGAATAGVIAMTGMLSTSAAADEHGGGTPTPVTGDPGFGGLHIWSPELGKEPSAITDFKGAVGAAIVRGTGVATTSTGNETLLFDTDMRFMQGIFRGTDGRNHRGTFAFI